MVAGAAGGGTAIGLAGVTGVVAAGGVETGAVNVGLGVETGVISRGGAAGAASAGTGVADFTAATGGTGFFSAAGGGTAGLGDGAAEVGGCLLMIAFRTSPGFEICERSILVLISSPSGRLGREERFGACASLLARKWTRTFSASCSSRELECVFFSVTPTLSSTSRIALLLTSSSLARSLIRTLLIRPLFPPGFPVKSSSQPHDSYFRSASQDHEPQSGFFLGCLGRRLSFSGCRFRSLHRFRLR